MSDILIVHPFENMIINVFGMHFDFIILHVSTIMEVPLLGLQIGPCLKCLCMCQLLESCARRNDVIMSGCSSQDAFESTKQLSLPNPLPCSS